MVTIRNNRPVVRGFANAGAVFEEKENSGKDGLHPQIVKMARKSGMLNLSNQGLEKGENCQKALLKHFHSYSYTSVNLLL